MFPNPYFGSSKGGTWILTGFFIDGILSTIDAFKLFEAEEGKYSSSSFTSSILKEGSIWKFVYNGVSLIVFRFWWSHEFVFWWIIVSYFVFGLCGGLFNNNGGINRLFCKGFSANVDSLPFNARFREKLRVFILVVPLLVIITCWKGGGLYALFIVFNAPLYFKGLLFRLSFDSKSLQSYTISTSSHDLLSSWEGGSLSGDDESCWFAMTRLLGRFGKLKFFWWTGVNPL